jgi:hypothetical protein
MPRSRIRAISSQEIEKDVQRNEDNASDGNRR